MAILHTKESALAKTKQRNFFLAAFFYGIAGIGWLWWVNNILFVHRILSFDTVVPIFVVFGGAGWLGRHFWRNYRKSASGDKGVERALDVLQRLPDDYEVFSNVVVMGRYCSIVVVGRNGVFIVQVKNHNGRIAPSRGKDWVQEKTGRGGTDYAATLRNPVIQLKGQIHAMAQFLKQEGIRVWVDGMVYFTNPDVILRDCSAEVTDNGNTILDFITNYAARHVLRDDEVTRISTWLQRAGKV